MMNITQKFPQELLAEVLEHVSARDALRCQTVNHAFCDAVLASPFIRHKIELFGAGLEYNQITEISLAESQKAFLRYRSGQDSLKPIKEGNVDLLLGFGMSSGGTYANVNSDNTVQLFTLGSKSQDIQPETWTLPPPTTRGMMKYSLYPGANVFTFAEDFRWSVDIHLRTLSGGEPHPAAQSPIIHYSKADIGLHGYHTSVITISGCRLVAIIAGYLVIWDWKSGQVLLELNDEAVANITNVEFIDDYRLLISSKAIVGNWLVVKVPADIVLLDTGRDVEGNPVETVFCLPPPFASACPYIQLEQGAHKPILKESQASFYQDPSQRIVVLHMRHSQLYLVFHVEALLGLLESHEGSNVKWDDWKGCVVIPIPSGIDLGPRSWVETWVSGCKLFSIHVPDSRQAAQVEVFDFSMQGCVKYLSKHASGNFNFSGVKCLSTTGVTAQIQLGCVFNNRDPQDGFRFLRDKILDKTQAKDWCVQRLWAF